MLGPTLSLVAIVVLAAALGISVIGSAARAAVATMAERELDAGVRHAISRFQGTIEAAIGPTITQALANGTPADPTLLSQTAAALAPAMYADSTQSLAMRETVTPTTVRVPACTGADPGASDLATEVQCSPWVQETRASIRILVDVLAPDGATPLAHRDVTVTLRLFALPPYSAVTGLKDTTVPTPTDPNVNDESTAAHEDDGAGRGASALSPDVRTGAGASGASDTAIHVQFQCMGATNCDRPRPPTPDELTNRTWQNGNTASIEPPP